MFILSHSNAVKNRKSIELDVGIGIRSRVRNINRFFNGPIPASFIYFRRFLITISNNPN